MIKIRLITETQGEPIAVPMDLPRHGAILEDLWDGVLNGVPCQAQGISIEEVKADLIEQGLLRK